MLKAGTVTYDLTCQNSCKSPITMDILKTYGFEKKAYQRGDRTHVTCIFCLQLRD